MGASDHPHVSRTVQAEEHGISEAGEPAESEAEMRDEDIASYVDEILAESFAASEEERAIRDMMGAIRAAIRMYEETVKEKNPDYIYGTSPYIRGLNRALRALRGLVATDGESREDV